MEKFPLKKEQIVELDNKYKTPFHIYFEDKIIERARSLHNAFAWCPNFRNYFAVKATPNPHILKLLSKSGMGMDCSSMTELVMMERIGISGEDIIFTSNNTPDEEFIKANQIGAIINIDDHSHISRLKYLNLIPKVACCRYLPDENKESSFFNGIIGSPIQSKFGIPKDKIIDSYVKLKALGVKRFGLHTMQASNERNEEFFINTADEMFRLAKEISVTVGINIEFINLGGGLGIAQHPDEEDINISFIGKEIERLYNAHFYADSDILPSICMENGRYITGPAGFIVSKVRHNCIKHKKYVGIDACMADLMRPALYKAYHHISTFKDDNAKIKCDVVGSLCENNDKFAIDRDLPYLNRDDYVIIHDTGAHGFAMGFNYNGKLKSPEIIYSLNEEKYNLIRRRESVDDLFSTLNMD